MTHLLIRLAMLLVIAGLSGGLAVLISNALCVRDLRGKIMLVLATILIGFAPFIDRMIQEDHFAYQRTDGTYVSADKVENGTDVDSKKPVTPVVVSPRQLSVDGNDLVLTKMKDIKTTSRWVFRPSGWKDALKYGIDLAGGTNLIYQAKEAKGTENQAINTEVMTRLVGAVMRRVNPSGTNEVVVRQVGTDRIEVIVPGADPAAVADVKEQITKLGSLEFSILVNSSDHGRNATKSTFDIIGEALAHPDQTVVRDPSNANRIVAAWVPVAPEHDKNGNEIPNTHSFNPADPKFAVRQRKDKPAGYYEVLLLRLPEDQRVTGQFLTRSAPTIDSEGRPAVEFRFNGEGAKRFGDITRENRASKSVDRRLAVVLDNQVHSAPSIEAVITDSGIIHGSFTQQEVEELVTVLNAGALPVELNTTPISEFTISPTLGADVQEKGMRSLWVSAVVVVVFMGVYYMAAGIVADLAMLLNLLFIAAAMAVLDAAFTLPGLAGLVLGAGMAVDANVLIYERIREELQRGASLRMAIHNGFDKAMSAIIDSNLTTIITALILYAIGTEQVKGFAIALLIGLVMNLYTAVFVSRVILTVLERGRVIRSLPMLQMIRTTKIDFLALRWPTAIASIVLIAGGLAAFASRGSANYDIDFNGGTMVTMLFNQDMETDDVRKSLSGVSEFGGDITLERLTLPGEAATGTLGRRFRLRTINQNEKLVSQKVSDTFSDKLVRYSLATGPIKAIPGPDAKKDARDPKAKAAPVDASAEIYAGGHEVVLDVASQGEPANVAPSMVSRYLADQMTAEGVKEPESLFVVEGLVGPGATAGEGQVRLYNKLRLRVSQAVKKDQLAKTIAAVKSTMASRPIFDEVTSFATSVADEAKLWAVLALLMSLVATVIYVWFRFETVIFGIAAVVALAHDVLVTLGCLALASYLSTTPIGPLLLLNDFKINMAIVAAFLTIVGYSLNDTIVIFDRLREIRGKAPTITRDMINLAVNQTLSRTILTALTVFLTVLILYALGGEGIHGFAFSMLIGTIAGSYSTVFIANPIVLWLVENWMPQPTPAARFSKPAAA